MSTKQAKTDKGRSSSKRKRQAVFRLLRGEDFHPLSRAVSRQRTELVAR